MKIFHLWLCLCRKDQVNRLLQVFFGIFLRHWIIHNQFLKWRMRTLQKRHVLELYCRWYFFLILFSQPTTFEFQVKHLVKDWFSFKSFGKIFVKMRCNTSLFPKEWQDKAFSRSKAYKILKHFTISCAYSKNYNVCNYFNSVKLRSRGISKRFK